jgi:hypothetical protein
MVGELSPEELPAIAAQALADGLDSPALRERPGVSALDPREARDVFLRAMNELEVTIPDQTTAMWRLVHLWMSRIASGELEPVEGLHRLAAAWSELGHPERLSIFGLLADDWEEFSAERDSVEREVVATATRMAREE